MPHILLIEDESNMMALYTVALQDAGYDVVTASDGRVGLKVLSQNKPDFVVCDIVMPVMDGFEVVEKIRKNATTKNIPVLMLTSLGHEEDTQHALHLGATDYMVKASTNSKELVQKIKSIISGT